MVPCDNSIQLEDLSQPLSAEESFHYRSVVGMCLYLARDRPDIMYVGMELSQKMSSPTAVSLQRLRKLIGDLNGTGDFCVVLEMPVPDHGRCKTSEEKTWILESHADSDWSGNKSHRRSTSCGLHVMNGQYMFGSSRTQRVVSLSSCEAELHALVSTLSDGIYIRRCFEFVIGAKIQHILLTDSSSARQLISRQGTGKAKHVSGKILWIQDHVRQAFVDVSQISTTWNIADIGTKPLSKQRMQLLLHEVGVHSGNGELRVGQEEFEQQSLRHNGGPQLSKLAKAVARVIMVLGLEPLSVAGAGIQGDDLQCSADMVVQSNDHGHFWVFSGWQCFFCCGPVSFTKRGNLPKTCARNSPAIHTNWLMETDAMAISNRNWKANRKA